MNKKLVSLVSLFSLVAISSTVFGATFAAWAVTDNANTKTANITIGGNLKTVRFYTSYNGSSWNDYQDVLVSDGGNIDSLDIPGLGISDYTFKGWNPSPLSLTNYSATYTNETLVNLTINQNYELYPVFESDSNYAFTNSTYYDVDTDITIDTNQIGPTKIGKKYYSISGIPNPVASWDSSRDLYSSSGIYKFQNDGGGAQIYRKIGFKPNSSWGGSWDGTPGFGIYAWQDDNNVSIHIGQSSGSTTLYTYIPASYENFKFSRYSHNESGFVWGNQSANLSFDNSWWWGGSGTNKYSKSSIVLSMKTWENWIDNWSSSDATWIS